MTNYSRSYATARRDEGGRRAGLCIIPDEVLMQIHILMSTDRVAENVLANYRLPYKLQDSSVIFMRQTQAVFHFVGG